MRCGGCGLAAEFAHGEPQYGRLVHHFLDQHEHCGNAVQIAPGTGPLLVSPLASRIPSGDEASLRQ